MPRKDTEEYRAYQRELMRQRRAAAKQGESTPAASPIVAKRAEGNLPAPPKPTGAVQSTSANTSTAAPVAPKPRPAPKSKEPTGPYCSIETGIGVLRTIDGVAAAIYWALQSKERPWAIFYCHYPAKNETQQWCAFKNEDVARSPFAPKYALPIILADDWNVTDIQNLLINFLSETGNDPATEAYLAKEA